MTITNVHTFSSDETALAREWIAECSWEDLDDEHVGELPTAVIWRGVARYYDGGVAQFLRDAHPDHGDDAHGATP